MNETYINSIKEYLKRAEELSQEISKANVSPKTYELEMIFTYLKEEFPKILEFYDYQILKVSEGVAEELKFGLDEYFELNEYRKNKLPGR